MEKKIYVEGLDDSNQEAVQNAISAVAGVTSCVATVAKMQILVNFDEGNAGIEDAINNAISSSGITPLN